MINLGIPQATISAHTIRPGKMRFARDVLRRLALLSPVAERVEIAAKLIARNYHPRVMQRFAKGTLFSNLVYEGNDVRPAAFTGKNIYVLTDQEEDSFATKLGPHLSSLDVLSDAEIANSVFYVYFGCDSDALPFLDRIVRAGGTYVPPLEFSKTSYRFIDRTAHDAIRRTAEKRDRISHFLPIVHENICEALAMTSRVEGDYVEIGVYLGGSALTALNYLEEALRNGRRVAERKAWLFDTFAGFDYSAARDSADAIWAGTHELFGADKTIAYVHETLSGSSVPFKLMKNDICSDPLPDCIKSIAVANIDVDMYDATLAALHKVSPRVSPAGIIICEDPASTPALYGAFLAMEQFLATEQGKAYTKIFKGGQYFLLKSAASGG